MTNVEVSFWWVIGLNGIIAAIILWPDLWKKLVLIALVVVASAAWWEMYQEYVWERKVKSAIQLVLDACVEGNETAEGFRSARGKAEVMLEIDRLPPARRWMLSSVLDSEMNRKGCGQVARARGLLLKSWKAQDEAGARQQAWARRSGYIIIYSNPAGSQVKVNGQYLSTTPIKQELDPGEHIIILEKPGYLPLPIYVKIRPGEAQTRNITLARAE